MPNPGLGSNATGDTPQEVVFLVTDGVEDKIVSRRCPNATFASNHRCQQPLDTTMCTTIKNRGIKIAILYTEYLQLINLGPSQNVTDSWYMSWVNPYDEPNFLDRRDRTESPSVRLAGLLLRRSNRRRHLDGADESVHQGRVKHRQPHAVRKAPWPKWKSAAGTRRRNRFVVFIRDSKGATAVEFALIATPFLALIAGLIQVFLLFFAQSVLENAVRASARQILTGQVQTQDASLSSAAAMAAFHQTVCNNANALFTCTGLMVDVAGCQQLVLNQCRHADVDL